jgi:hypothetical protein
MVLPTACNELFELLELDEKHFESLKKAIWIKKPAYNNV